MPMPPPMPGLGIGWLSSGSSTMRTSVVKIMPAMLAAFCSAVRVTLAGSMMPLCHHVDKLAGQSVVTDALLFVFHPIGDDRASTPAL